LPGDPFKAKQLVNDFNYLKSEYQRMIDEHKKAAQRGIHTDDFISSYLKKIEEEKDVEDSTFTGRWPCSII